jgi:hypothetical protein
MFNVHAFEKSQVFVVVESTVPPELEVPIDVGHAPSFSVNAMKSCELSGLMTVTL